MKILLIEDDKNLCEMLAVLSIGKRTPHSRGLHGWTRRAGSGFAGCL